MSDKKQVYKVYGTKETIPNKRPVIEIRSVYDTIEDAPYFTGSEADARDWCANNPEAEVWFFVTNGDGSVETVSQYEFMNAGA